MTLLPDRRHDGHTRNLVNRFARSFAKLVSKDMPPLDLAESVLRARMLAVSNGFADGLPAGCGPLIGSKELEMAVNPPARFDRALMVGERHLGKKGWRLTTRLTGLPPHKLRRLARSGLPLTEEEARSLDESPFGREVLRVARAQGLRISSLAEVNPAALPRMAKEVGQRKLARGAEERLIEIVYRTTGHWYLADVANLLHSDARALENRTVAFRRQLRARLTTA